MFRASLDFLEWYLFQLSVLLKPDSNYFNGFIFSWVDKVATGTQNFVLVILNFGNWFAAVPAVRMPFLEHVNWRGISQLIKDNASVLQKLLRYFNETLT